jgi:hypothetical protein
MSGIEDITCGIAVDPGGTSIEVGVNNPDYWMMGSFAEAVWFAELK